MKKAMAFLLVILLALTVTVAGMKYTKRNHDESMRKDEPMQKKDVSQTDLSEQIPKLSQFPTLPTGCEATAAAMLLQFYGESVSPKEFAEHWLPRSENFYTTEEKLHGPDPKKYFLGDPFSQNSYGCYAPAIVNAVNDNCDGLCAMLCTEKTLEELYREYVSRGDPLLVWTTIAMKESKPGRSWLLDDGTNFTWITGEHCMVLCGNDDRFYYFIDPQSGSVAGYEKEVSEQRFRELGTQAVRIQPN